MKFRYWWLELVRATLSIVFIVSGLVKAIDPLGTISKVAEYQSSLFGITSPTLLSLSSPIAVVLIALEFLTGALLLAGVYRRLAARLSFLLMLLMTLLTGYIYLSDMRIDCGCFGEAIKLTPGETFLKNIILLPMAYLLATGSRKLRHLYSRRERWIPLFLASIGILYMIYESYTDLPYVDFLPYKVGVNLPQSMQEADAQMQDLLDRHTRYIYEREGSEQSFAMDSLPDDNRWRFVRIEQPSFLQLDLLQYDFSLLSYDGDDKTDSILSDKQGVFLLCSNSWSDANLDKIDVYNELYRYTKQHGYQLYGVSSGSEEDAEQWRYHTGAIYPILFLDGTTIKSLTRSNPGLIILKSGTILDKVPSERMPTLKEIPTFVESRLRGEEYTEPKRTRWVLLLAWGVFIIYGLLRRLLRRVIVARYMHLKQVKITQDVIDTNKNKQKQ